MLRRDNAEKRRQRQQQQYATDENRQRKARSAVESLHQKTPFRDHTLAEREAAINLAQLARSDVNSQLGGDRVEELVRTLYVSLLHSYGPLAFHLLWLLLTDTFWDAG